MAKAKLQNMQPPQPGVAVDQQVILDVQGALLRWFAEEGSVLPWRQAITPYKVLVSEFMLQQTGRDRVAAKLPLFLKRFPSIEALASATPGDVIRAWAGLGYNSRAIRLHAIARSVVERGGQLPSDIESLRSLPGIGVYTAGAVACFGFGADVSFVDTNIRRVLARVFLGEEYPAAATKRDAALAATVLPRGNAFAWNSALMDLGARICTARTPDCAICPVRDSCRAYSAFGQRTVSSRRLVAEASTPYSAVGRKNKRAVPKPYLASNRFLRGRILDVLRRLPEGLELQLAQLALAATGMALPPQDERVGQLADRLAQEGLVDVATDTAGQRLYRLPG